MSSSISLDEYILLACDLQQLLIAVTIHACSSSGSQYFRIVEDLIILLGYLTESKNENLQCKFFFVYLYFRMRCGIKFTLHISREDQLNTLMGAVLPATVFAFVNIQS